MIPLALVALPLAGLGALLFMHRSHKAEVAARRGELRGPAEALRDALNLTLAVNTSDMRSGSWELSGRVFDRETRIRVANDQAVMIEVRLVAGMLSAAHPDEFGRGGLDSTLYPSSSHHALPAGWRHSGPARLLDGLPRSLRGWLEQHPLDGIVDGKLVLNRAMDDVEPDLRALQHALDS